MATISESFSKALAALKGQTVLVTGGCGFLGRHIVELLLEVGSTVRVFDVFINKYAADEEKAGRLTFIKGDLLNAADVEAAAKGCLVIFHVASPSPLSKNPKLFFDVNVNGTKNVLQVARTLGINRFVYTSSASVMFEGKDQKGLDESTRPAKSVDQYTQSKLLGEREVLQANSATLWTCAIRPHAIFGPREPHLMPKLAQTGKEKKSRYIIGDASNVVDFTYVTNVAYAHLLAAVSLRAGAPICGNAYFITNKHPLPFWDFMTRLNLGLGYGQPWLSLPYGMMLMVGTICDQLEKIGRKPIFTSQVVKYTGTHHYYSADKATRDFGYTPAVTMPEAIDRTVKSFANLKNPNPKPAKFSAMPVKKKGLLLALALVALIVLGTRGQLPRVFPLALWSFTWWLSAAFWAFVIGYPVKWIRWFFATQRPYEDKSDLTGKTLVITGSNKGIGFSTAEFFAERGARVILACRDKGRAQEAVNKLKAVAKYPDQISFVQLDLGSLASVRACVQELKRQGRKMHWLINNAGAMIQKGTTVDGYDDSFQSNYLGHFYWTNLLLDEQMFMPKARIVHVASVLHRYGTINFNDLMGTKRSWFWFPLDDYANSKLANVLFSNELHWRRFSSTGVPSIVVHPGIAETEFFLHFIPMWLFRSLSWLWPIFVNSNRAASSCSLYAALSPELDGVGGVYLDNSRIVAPSVEARNTDVADRLWEVSEKLIRDKDPAYPLHPRVVPASAPVFADDSKQNARR